MKNIDDEALFKLVKYHLNKSYHERKDAVIHTGTGLTQPAQRYRDFAQAVIDVALKDLALDAERWVSESDSKPLEADGEVFVRFSDGTFGIGWASYWHGASNDFAQWCHPDPDEDRTVTHWMKPPTIDAAIAAAKGE